MWVIIGWPSLARLENCSLINTKSYCTRVPWLHREVIRTGISTSACYGCVMIRVVKRYRAAHPTDVIFMAVSNDHSLNLVPPLIQKSDVRKNLLHPQVCNAALCTHSIKSEAPYSFYCVQPSSHCTRCELGAMNNKWP